MVTPKGTVPRGLDPSIAATDPSDPWAPRARNPVVASERCRILFINPQEQEPLRRLGLPSYRQWIAEVAGISPDQIQMVNVADGESLPATIEVHGVIGGGSGHSSYEPLPWIQRTKEYLREVQRRGVPELHLCWSHQAKAESIGSRCAVGHAGRRFGVERLTLTPMGRQDLLFRSLPDEFDIFTSHMDVVYDVPAWSEFGGVTELAYSGTYRNEVLAVGATARTFQAHPELTADITTALARSRRAALVQEGHIGSSDAAFHNYIAELHRADHGIRARMQTVVGNWLRYFVGPRVNSLAAVLG
jgi:GMP synthase (glutamine-hydrolysing)